MENKNQITMEPRIELAESDWNNSICIPRSRYDELIRTEMEREILFRAYQSVGTFNMESVMDAIFNSKFKYQRKETANSKAGAEDAE